MNDVKYVEYRESAIEKFRANFNEEPVIVNYTKQVGDLIIFKMARKDGSVVSITIKR